MAQSYQSGRRERNGRSAPRGVERREAILRAAIAVVGERGADALTHRAVAERANVPLSATTYYFDSKEDLFREAMALASREEVARLERLVLELAPQQLTPAEWARELSSDLMADLEAEPAKHVALYELALKAARDEALRRDVARWQESHLRLAELGLRAAGSSDPVTDARIVVATLGGLILGQLVSSDPDFERDVLQPTLERLFESLRAQSPAEAPAGQRA
jgi:DNA-binding transcriptional regulator YbjK